MQKKAAVMACMLAVIFAVSGIAYAATDGQIVHTVKVWINGEEQAVLNDESLVIETKDGDEVVIEDGDTKTEVRSETNAKIIQNEEGTEVEIHQTTI